MARNFSSRGVIERRDGDLGLFSGVTDRESKLRSPLGQRKMSEYGKQFRAKQMAKRMYGVLERQFRNYFKKANSMAGSTGENLLRLLECRLDNIVYRLGFARTRAEARQLVSHKSIIVNNGKTKRVVNIPSYQVKAGDEVVIVEAAQKQGRIQEAVELAKLRLAPEWLEALPEEFKGVVKRMPERNEMPLEINELLIVELYSK